MPSTVLALLLVQASAHVPVVEVLGPGDDWCAEIAQSATSDTFQFLPGDYYGPCTVVGPLPDQVGERLVIESFYPPDPAVFHAGPGGDFVLGLEGFSVTVRAVSFAPLDPGLVAIEAGGEDMIVEKVELDGSAGVGVRQAGDLIGLEVWDNQWALAGGTAVELGCAGCASEDHFLRENLFLGADVAVLAAGDGAWGRLWENVIGQGTTAVSWRGHGVEQTLIEQNLLHAEAGEALRLEGGRVLARNNVVVGTTRTVGPGEHGIHGNTLYGGAEPLQLEAWAAAGLAVRNNALSGGVSASAPTEVAGNVVCELPCVCWYDAEGWDFYPSPDSPLRTAGAQTPFGELLGDWCGNPRQNPPSVGAFEGLTVLGPAPLQLVGRDLLSCSMPPDPPQGEEPDPCGTTTGPGDTGVETGTATGAGLPGPEPTRRAGKSAGCGCAKTGPAGWAPAALLIVLLARRRLRI